MKSRRHDTVNRITPNNDAVFRATLIAAALLTTGGVASAGGTDIIADNTAETLVDGDTYKSATARNSGTINGQGVTLSGYKPDSEKGTVFVDTSGSISLVDSNVANNIPGNGSGGARGVNARGAGATIDLRNTNVSVNGGSATDIGFANAAAAVAATYGGLVTLDGGTIDSRGNFVFGLTASGNANSSATPAGGERIQASNLNIETTGDRGFGVQALGVNRPEDTGKSTTVTLATVRIGTQGVHAFGIQSANKGAAVSGTDVTVSTTKDGSVGIAVDKGGTLDLNDVHITTAGNTDAGGQQATGIRVGGAGSDARLTNYTMATSGNAAPGATVSDNASLALHDGTIQTAGINARGLYVTSGAVASATGTRITTQAKGADVAVADGGSIHLTNATLAANYRRGPGGGQAGIDTHVLVARDGGVITGDHVAISGSIDSYGEGVVHAGANGLITLNNSTVDNTLPYADFSALGVSARGANAAVRLNNTAVTLTSQKTGYGSSTAAVGATLGGQITLDGGSISANGSYVNGLTARGNDTLGGGERIIASNLNVIVRGANGFGVQAYGNDTSSGTATDTIIDLNRVNVTTESTHATAIQASKKGAKITGGTIQVTTAGNESSGIVADRGGSADLQSGVITTTGGAAIGARAAQGGTVSLRDFAIATRGTDAYGASVEGSGSSFALIGGTITTQGGGAHGLAITGNGSATLSGARIDATGGGASGISLKDSGSVTLDNTLMTTAGASIASQLTLANQTQNIIVGAGSNLTANNGALLQVARNTQGMDGTINLTLKAGSVSAGNIVDLDGLDASGTRADGGKVNLKLERGAQWAGAFDGAAGDTELDSGASYNSTANATIAGNVTGQTNTNITFQRDATIGGNVTAQTGSSTQFGGTTHIAGNVQGTGSAFTFSQNAPTAIGGNVSGAGSSFVFGQNAPTTIGGHVSGAGSSFVFSQSAPTQIAGNVSLANQSSLRGGTAATPIHIQGNATANSNSVLGGNLVVDGALGGAGGTLSPGNSVGVQTYGTSGGFSGAYVAEVNAKGGSDLIIIQNGNFDLSAIDLFVSQENGHGGAVLNHDYTIVRTAAGSVVNPFHNGGTLDDTFNGTLVKLDPVKYDSRDVRIRLAVDNGKVANAKRDMTANQRATLDGMAAVAGENALADSTLLMQPGARKDALTQLSGELHGSMLSALLKNSEMVTRTLSRQLRANLGTVTSPGALIAAASDSPPSGAAPRSSTHLLWIQAVGGRNMLDGDGNAATATTDTYGVFLGGDADVGKGWRLGAAIGYTNGHTTVRDREARANVDSYTLAVYGGNRWAAGAGSLNFLAGGAYTIHDVDSHRSVSVGGRQTLDAGYRVDSAQLFTELGYGIPIGKRGTIEPYVGLEWLGQTAAGFTEHGGLAALRGKRQRDDIASVTVGLRGDTALDMRAGQARAFAGLGWRHASGDLSPGRSLAFLQSNGESFRTTGAPIAKNAAVADLGIGVAVGRNTTISLGYNGQYGGGNTDHSGSLFVRARF